MDALAGAGGQQVLSPYHAMGCNPAMMVDPLGLRSDVFDNGARPIDNTPRVSQIIPMNTNARYILLDQIMYADQAAFIERRRQELTTQAVLEALDYGLSLLGFESRSISAALGRSTSSPGEIVQGNDQYDNNVGGDRTKDGVKETRVSQTFGELEFNYSVFNDGSFAGLWVFAIYRGDMSAYKKTDWIQSVFTTSGGKAQYTWFNDYNENPDKELYGVANPPFYYAKGNSDRLRNSRDSEFGGRTFNDRPNRSITRISVGWTAELTLVGYRNGRWEPIVNVFYGFSAKNGNVNILFPVVYTGRDVSPYQQSLINTAKKP